MKFTKMHGLGNDYLYVYQNDEPEDPAELSIRLSDRHFGAGSDGMIWILPSDKADFKMRIFNADGSEAMMCGNGIRCVGKYVYDKGHTKKTHLEIETLSGIKILDLFTENGQVDRVSVDMGKAAVEDEKAVETSSRKVRGVPVNVGNPHFVIFTDDAENAPLDTLGKELEKSSVFPGGVNVEFVQVTGENSMRMRVWERGSGITMACGTGACASAAAAVAKGYFKAGNEITVRLDGGDLYITVSEDGNVLMKGPAVTVYEGETEK